MFSGTLRVRDRVRFGEGKEGGVTAIAVFDRGASERRASVAAGRIGRLWGLGDVRIGDTIGGSPAASSSAGSPRRPWRRSSSPAGRPTRAPCTPP